jgi:hypothetical protein
MLESTPIAFVDSVAKVLEERAQAGAAAAARGSGPVSALHLVARYVRDLWNRHREIKTNPSQTSRPITESWLHALYVANGSKLAYVPGGWQARYLAELATDFRGWSDPAHVLAELACYAVRPAVGALGEGCRRGG